MDLNNEQIQHLLPHRPPLLIIREMRNVVAQEKGTGVRLFKESDNFFEGHFPGRPILPGIFITEGCAQAAMAVLLANQEKRTEAGNTGLLARIEKMQFLEMVIPPMEVFFSISVERKIGPFAFVSCLVHNDRQELAKGQLVLKLMNEESG